MILCIVLANLSKKLQNQRFEIDILEVLQPKKHLQSVKIVLRGPKKQYWIPQSTKKPSKKSEKFDYFKKPEL